MIGVHSIEFLDRLPLILKRNGAENIMTVCSDPNLVGLHKSSIIDIQIKTKEDAIKKFVGAINNTANQAIVETTAFNAAGGLIVAGIVNNFEDGVELALNTIKEGKAFKLLERFVSDTGNISKLKEVV